MNVKELYKQKLTTAEEAVKLVQDGWRVTFPIAIGQPPALMTALARRKEEFTHLDVLLVIEAYASELMMITREDSIDIDYIVPVNKKVIQDGTHTYTPARLGQMTKFLDMGRPQQVVMMQVAPMDEHGYFSMGTNCDFALPLGKRAEKVIVQVNENMPRTFGRNFFHVSEIDAIVEENVPLSAIPVMEPNENEKMIGNYVAELVEDGSTIQLGIGSLPNAVAYSLENKKDLGVHTEAMPDAIRILWEKGVITNRRKTFHPDVMLTSFAAGSTELYKWLDNNPAVHFYPVDYILDPYLIGKNNKMVAVNSALQVDLTGQINAESIGYKQFSHGGGQLDMMMGAFNSEGGKGIIAIESTTKTKQGIVSKIAAHLDYGSFVTTGRGDVNYVVTEYGIADIKVWSARERAKRLIAIAHPDFRDELTFEAKKCGLL
ncbi:MAG: 4-hydroxybutyrate CoA-transferase [Syntrophomonadaceae bacterium]|jgi:4-hydroxybutyrate CoA-transferase|nr:4-hydroxybutyrate CoA-transferase [Syntrophomonadaceae bacterium]